jgi:hypothetical protein
VEAGSQDQHESAGGRGRKYARSSRSVAPPTSRCAPIAAAGSITCGRFTPNCRRSRRPRLKGCGAATGRLHRSEASKDVLRSAVGHDDFRPRAGARSSAACRAGCMARPPLDLSAAGAEHGRNDAGDFAAHCTDEGPGGRADTQRSARGVSELEPGRGGAPPPDQRHAAGAIANWCTQRRRGSSFTSDRCWSKLTSVWWRWTKRIALANGPAMFRPSYRNFAGLKQRFGNGPLLALTATATRRVE